MSALVIRSHPRCMDHVPLLGHPETPHRVRAILEALRSPPAGPWLLDEEAALPPDQDIEAVLRWIHEPEYVERIREASSVGRGFVDGEDCPVSPGTFGAAVAAAGVTLASALDVANGRVHRAFLVVRPPGHHAAPARASGMCFFNNVAVAAEVLTRAWNAPVLIVDFDVHHGDSTQQLFYNRGDVGYISLHRYPFFPGSGAGDEVGEGAGEGANRNLPLAVGAGDDVYVAAIESALEDMGARLRPAAVLVSAGFGAHQLDPMGGMMVTDDGFRRITAAIVQAARTWCGGTLLSILEGGHNPTALATAARAHAEALADIRG